MEEEGGGGEEKERRRVGQSMKKKALGFRTTPFPTIIDLREKIRGSTPKGKGAFFSRDQWYHPNRPKKGRSPVACRKNSARELKKEKKIWGLHRAFGNWGETSTKMKTLSTGSLNHRRGNQGDNVEAFPGQKTRRGA